MRGIPKQLRLGRGGFCPVASAWLALHAKVVYEPFLSIRASFHEVDLYPILIETFSKGGTQAILAEYPEFVVVAFRGTERNFEDILTDLDIRKRSLQTGAAGRVHGGFLKAYEDIAQPLILSTVAKSKPVYLTGHSLGGALAVVCSAVCDEAYGFTPTAIYTFGSPRVGNRSFTQTARVRSVPHQRITHGADIVPLVPFVTLSFRHTGQHIHLGYGQIQDMAQAVLTGLRSFHFPRRFFMDHRIDRYIAALGRLADA